MKLLDANIQNFRVHSGEQPLVLQFHPELNIIRGPNEAGKSTLVDALRTALFERATLTGKAWEAMKPYNGATPSIEVSFEVEGTQHTVRKRFKGQSGTAELLTRRQGELVEHFSGANAEAELQRLLGVPEQPRGERKPENLAQWRLLWIDQGASIKLPTDALNADTRDQLQNLLAKETGAALTTEAEAAWIANLEERVSQIFTPTGKPKAGSELKRAEKNLAELEAELRDCRARRDDVEQTSERASQVAAELHTLSHTQLPELRERQQTLHERLEQCRDVEQRIERVASQMQLVQTTLERDHAELQRARELQNEIEALAHQAQTLETALADRRQEMTALAHARADAELQDQHSETELRDAERRYQRAAAHLEYLKTTAELGQMRAAVQAAEDIQEQLKAVDHDIAGVGITPADLERLRTAQSNLDKAQASLEAASVRIRVHSQYSVRLTPRAGEQRADHREDGSPKDAGDSAGQANPGAAISSPAAEAREFLVDQESTLAVGDHLATVEITPGGDDLAKRRERVREARNHVHRLLSEHGLTTLQDAATRVEQRNELLHQQRELSGKLQATAPEGIAVLRQRFDAQQQACHAALSAVQRHTHEPDTPLPDDLGEAQQRLRTLEQAKRDAEHTRNQARTALHAASVKEQQAAQDLQRLGEQRKGLDEKTQAAHDQLAQCRDSTTLEAALQQHRETLAGLQTQQTELASERDALVPEHTRAEAEQVNQAVEQAEHDLRALEAEHSGLRSRLDTLDAVGLHERVGDLEARVAATREHLQRQSAYAEALQLLRDTTRACREEMTQEIMRPLQDRVTPLLRIIFGDATVGFGLDERHGDLRLQPLARHEARDDFDKLSMGAREQVGIAVRLALAQILSESHGGRIPVVLDEPFVNTDPQRRQRVLAMLNAVKHQLQLIILTCDYSAYRALGLASEQVQELAP